MTRYPTLVALILICLTVLGICEDDSAGRPDLREADAQICGPRAVKYILSYYGEEMDLIELVHQMQWPELNAGIDFVGVKGALEARGVACKAVRIGRLREFRWKNPVVLHLRGQQSDLGHYVVWLPSSSESTWHIWDGLLGVRAVSPNSLEHRLSNVAILTSADPMETWSTYAFRPKGRRLTVVAVLLAIAVAFGLAWLGIGRCLFHGSSERK